jgi:hypothetical protein
MPIDIDLELGQCRARHGGPLDAATRDLLRTLVATPTREQWAAARELVVGADATTTLAEACTAVAPLVPQLATPGAAVIAAGLRRAAGTEQQHTERARKIGAWPSLRAFYADDPVREFSGETDFGMNWTFGGQTAWPRWRVSWVAYTGELYAYAQTPGPHERVILVGVEPDEDRVEATLDGWADPDHAGHQLAWVFRQFGWSRLPEAVWAASARG